MIKRRDITKADDVKLLVDGFYAQVRVDPLLGGIFNGVIGDRWPVHLEKMYRFWGTVLLNEGSYTGAPFRPHIQLPVGQEHFERWLQLFNGTVDAHFDGPIAKLAKLNGERMAEMFLARIELLRDEPQRFIR